MVSTSKSNASLDAQFVTIVDELTADLLAGKQVDFDEVIERHPQHAQSLREIQPTLTALAQWGDAELPAEQSQASAGRLALGDYKLLRVLGRGGMGIVYEAEQLSLGRRVAVKMLPFAALLDARQLARFKNEARAAAALDHANIVSVYAVGQDRGVHFYAMHLIEGMSLAEAMSASGESRVESREKEEDESLVNRDAKVVIAPVRTERSDLAERRPPRHPGRGRPAIRPRRRHRPPRHQTVELVARRKRQAVRHRLRPGHDAW